MDFLTYNEDDPRVEELIKSNQNTADPKQENVSVPDVTENGATGSYYLQLSNGKEIVIPDDGGIIGRTEIGAEELAEFPSVSRQHLRVTPRRNIGLLVEDISRFGTLVDGQRLVKNTPVRAASGSRITLCNVDLTLKMKGDDK